MGDTCCQVYNPAFIVMDYTTNKLLRAGQTSSQNLQRKIRLIIVDDLNRLLKK